MSEMSSGNQKMPHDRVG